MHGIEKKGEQSLTYEGESSAQASSVHIPALETQEKSQMWGSPRYHLLDFLQ